MKDRSTSVNIWIIGVPEKEKKKNRKYLKKKQIHFLQVRKKNEGPQIEKAIKGWLGGAVS